ncbi:MAG: DUF5906 domain-containing protein [Saccharospirillaceae bacterium]|nr:DUF5906 domain-containing protein [Saccharospirillaceae bacterium]
MASVDTDFNDLHLSAGLCEVKTQVEAAIAKAQLEAAAPSVGEVVPDVPDYFDEPPAPSDVGDGFSGGVVFENGRYSADTLLANFSYIYNTDTCWDNITRQQMKLSHLNHLVGKDRYKDWNESRMRKTVKELVFEPGKDCGPDVVNLYEGWGVEPSFVGESGCRRILDHVMRLAKGEKKVADFMLNWLAYPLQNPGAKMATSCVIFGSEGTGKSILYDGFMGKIYGAHTITIGQAQLESSFTEWQSKKLFAVAEEVVARTERNHYKGLLKHLVTGRELLIDQKHMPLRRESNHLNFVFLSNSSVPLELDLGDRRYLVLYSDEVPNPQYFKDLFAEADNGGVEAFFGYLLKRDLTGFDQHSKPPMTEAKDELIGSSMTSPQYFHRQWSRGELDWPYTCAATGDLFQAFKHWCEENNEFRRNERFFAQELKRVMKPQRLNINYPTEKDPVRTVRVWVRDDDPTPLKEDESINKFIGRCCRNFKLALTQANVIREETP